MIFVFLALSLEVLEILTFIFPAASQGGARRGIHFQHPAEEDTGAQEREGVTGPELRARRRVPDKRPLSETQSAP